MTNMKFHAGGVVSAPDDPEVLSVLMVHGFSQAESSEMVTGVHIEGATVTDGTEVVMAIMDRKQILPKAPSAEIQTEEQ